MARRTTRTRPSLPNSKPRRIGSRRTARRPPPMTSGRWPSCSPPRTTRAPSGPPSTPSGTSSCGSEPRPSRPPSRGGKRGVPTAPPTPAPTAARPAKFDRWRTKPVVTVIGRVRVERAYYLCQHCHAGHCPRDAAWGLTKVDLSRGATEAVALAGAVSSFAEAATKNLPKLSGLARERIDRRAGDRAGREDVGKRLRAGQTFGAKRHWKWSKDAEGKSVGYVSADATGVGMQGENGAEAGGSDGVGGDGLERGEPGQVRYVCGLTGGLKALGESLRNQAAQVGMDRAQRWVAISDGGAGIEDWLRENFPRVEAVILDFYHAAEYLGDVGEGAAPRRQPRRRTWRGRGATG